MRCSALRAKGSFVIPLNGSIARLHIALIYLVNGLGGGLVQHLWS
jgi:hypothetical protein